MDGYDNRQKAKNAGARVEHVRKIGLGADSGEEKQHQHASQPERARKNFVLRHCRIRFRLRLLRQERQDRGCAQAHERGDQRDESQGPSGHAQPIRDGVPQEAGQRGGRQREEQALRSYLGLCPFHRGACEAPRSFRGSSSFDWYRHQDHQVEHHAKAVGGQSRTRVDLGQTQRSTHGSKVQAPADAGGAHARGGLPTHPSPHDEITCHGANNCPERANHKREEYLGKVPELAKVQGQQVQARRQGHDPGPNELELLPPVRKDPQRPEHHGNQHGDGGRRKELAKLVIVHDLAEED
mmetsp:Transcript_5959/g.17902  ORF Transcript_5959/g.17902 Transcript_5959/m.17902 type:complete len:296 (-) Transcript_5959:656-1543(-)